MLRYATKGDMKKVWVWRNDEITRLMSFNSEEVSWGNHQKWYESIMVNPDRHLFICEDEASCAVIRLDMDGDSAEVSINVDPEQRKKGHGLHALLEVQEKMQALGIKTLIARIKPENVASIQCFAKAGFENVQSDDGIVTMKYG